MGKFDELWNKIAKTNKLTNMTILDMPKVISSETKKMLVRSGKNVDELADMIQSVINEIDRGSIERLDVLLQRELNKDTEAL